MADTKVQRLGRNWMIIRFCMVALAIAASTPVSAQADLAVDFDGALRGCESWVLDPASWTDGFAQFPSRLGLAGKAGWVASVDEVALPPPDWRKANHFLRINSAPNAGFILVVSDRVPMCHITGGGGVDLQPAIESELASDAFRSRWDKVDSNVRDDMVSTRYRNRSEPKLEIVISRAAKAGERLDRVQVLATALYGMTE